jgi:hypothetical protein
MFKALRYMPEDPGSRTDEVKHFYQSTRTGRWFLLNL